MPLWAQLSAAPVCLPLKTVAVDKAGCHSRGAAIGAPFAHGETRCEADHPPPPPPPTPTTPPPPPPPPPTPTSPPPPHPAPHPPPSGFPVSSEQARKRFYVYSNWLYQAGVFLSRSSGMLWQVGGRCRRGCLADVRPCVLTGHWLCLWPMMRRPYDQMRNATAPGADVCPALRMQRCQAPAYAVRSLMQHCPALRTARSELLTCNAAGMQRVKLPACSVSRLWFVLSSRIILRRAPAGSCPCRPAGAPCGPCRCYRWAGWPSSWQTLSRTSGTTGGSCCPASQRVSLGMQPRRGSLSPCGGAGAGAAQGGARQRERCGAALAPLRQLADLPCQRQTGCW